MPYPCFLWDCPEVERDLRPTVPFRTIQASIVNKKPASWATPRRGPTVPGVLVGDSPVLPSAAGAGPSRPARRLGDSKRQPQGIADRLLAEEIGCFEQGGLRCNSFKSSSQRLHVEYSV